ncbi:hypothetical protein SAPIO_CDS0780 [Scedosporium apiospermum]|uniref:PNPLA domain-containing protein n=1 Tax=Pseudallescheria apiosperma TaxID=563466 RepID=A0A084GGJ0_PSEDA|nr:uncharacterized protein SAPIO_CDS0780 [Scedosporium apiospermum]KEZ46452.1 hypothetical protein SAPIO_CDS0780 [Scedosporium apiospermum]
MESRLEPWPNAAVTGAHRMRGRASKSGLINLLIKGLNRSHRDFEAPIVGVGQNEQRPTSGDVHLHIDPTIIQSDHPKLYADCEGLNGGNSPPQSLAAAAKYSTKKMLQRLAKNVRLYWRGSEDAGHQISPYFGFAFDHFASENGLKAPFDFVKASFSLQPVCRDFGDNIVYLASVLIKKELNSDLDAAAIFNPMSRDQPMCLSCLMNVPEYVLPCNHILCKDCAIFQGNLVDWSDDRLIKSRQCPLDPSDEGETHIRLQKPDMGVRVLSLNGGGIRGIVTLAILRELELRLGGIPIHSFFDLIVGTSVGGIIAAGLAKKGWTATECAEKFKELCGSAFVPTFVEKYVGQSLPFDRLTFLIGYFLPRFDTKGVVNALIEAFGPGSNLFGGGHDLATAFQPKVARVATESAGKAVLVADYNRAGSENTHCGFIHQTNLSARWKIWEAARATSAAPTWFERYSHASTGKSYVDGGLNHNNPVYVARQEHQLLWPQSPLDLLVSLGTGLVEDIEDTTPAEEPPPNQGGWIRWKKWLGSLELIQTAINHISNSLNSQRTWAQFEKDNQSERERIIRLNNKLNPPFAELHDVHRIQGLEEETRQYWQKDRECKEMLDSLARRLLASSFYFVVNSTASSEHHYSVQGEIRCRFSRSADTKEISKLGQLFESIQVQDPSYPCFEISQEGFMSQKTLAVTESVIKSMIDSNEFVFPEGQSVSIQLGDRNSKCEVVLCLGQDERYHISGSPRTMSRIC